MARKGVDLTGKVFGRLTVLASGEPVYGKKGWKCICVCGVEVNVYGCSLQTRNTLSCGCLGREMRILASKTHGLTKSPEYKAWVNIRSRCYNDKDERYVNYGARGILVCPTWLASFEAFYADMGPRPGEGYSIDRLNNDGDYEPGNCAWRTQKEQCRNKRNTRTVLHNGVETTVAALAEESGVPYQRVYKRLFLLDWSPEAAIQRLDDVEVDSHMTH
jgi:hypothetical protein